MAHHHKGPAELSREEFDQVPVLWRDRCAAYLKPLNDCRLKTFSLPWKCEHERNAFMKCEADYWRERAAEANAQKLADLAAKTVNYMQVLKMCLKGGQGVGKSALRTQYIEGSFVEAYVEQDENDTFHVFGNGPVIVDLFDLSEKSEYAAMRDPYLRAMEGFLVVYDVTSRQSFDEAQTSREQILRVKDAEEFPIVLVGNKIDLNPEDRQVPIQEGAEMAKSWRVPFFETSAKTNHNVREIFHAMATLIEAERTKSSQIQSTYHEPKKSKCLVM